MNTDRTDDDERLTCHCRQVEEVEEVLPVVVVSKMMVCGGWRGRQKLTAHVVAIVAASLEVTTGLLAWRGGCW